VLPQDMLVKSSNARVVAPEGDACQQPSSVVQRVGAADQSSRTA
jgi:hypothetical protein